MRTELTRIRSAELELDVPAPEADVPAAEPAEPVVAEPVLLVPLPVVPLEPYEDEEELSTVPVTSILWPA